MANFTPCRSLFLKDTDFKIIRNDGSVVVSDATAQSIEGVIKSSCGLAFDSKYFKKLSNCMSIASATSASNVTSSPCSGTVFDSAYFTLTGNVLSYSSGMNATLTFTTTPPTATVGLKDGNGASVPVSGGIANVILGRTYTWTCSADTYTTQTGTILIDSASVTKNITLVLA